MRYVVLNSLYLVNSLLPNGWLMDKITILQSNSFKTGGKQTMCTGKEGMECVTDSYLASHCKTCPGHSFVGIHFIIHIY